jgi:energy-coupling factor transporter ATP-binding protein EcfA2
VLFTGSVAENVAYGREVEREQIVRAAKAAGAHTFISELPHGYDTPLGPRAVGLSGGQRQRIAVARTFLRDPPILVLDEPTAGLDRESEARVLEGLETLAQGRTTVIISHSEALVATAQRVIVVDRGRVVRDGPPADALADEPEPPVRRELRSPVGRDDGLALPADPELPRLPELLDPHLMAGVLARSLGDGAAPPVVRVRSIRYRPGFRLVVRYDVGLGDSWHQVTAQIARDDLSKKARDPGNLALARLVDGRSPAIHPLFYEPRLGALIQWLPLDLSLPALAEPPAALRRRLRAAGVNADRSAAEPSLLNYRPHRRAVFRLDGHVLKFYAKERAFATALAGLRASTGLRSVEVPRFEGMLPQMRMTVQSYASGSPIPSPAWAAAQAGEILSTVHRRGADGLRSRPPVKQLEAAARAAELVGWIVPKLRGRLDSLFDRLQQATPSLDGFVTSHGDFSPRQLIEGAHGLILTDFDAMCLAPPALDLSAYGVRAVRGEADDLDDCRSVLDALLEGYGDVPAGLDWYMATALLRRSAQPFRTLEEHWRARVESIIDTAEAFAGP